MEAADVTHKLTDRYKLITHSTEIFIPQDEAWRMSKPLSWMKSEAIRVQKDKLLR